MATILYYRRSSQSNKNVPEYIVISDALPEELTEEELDNWCDTGYSFYSKHKLEGDVVQLPCDTILVPEHKKNKKSFKTAKKITSKSGFFHNLLK